VLAVYKEKNEHKLSMRGHVEAESGKLGKWVLSQNQIVNYGNLNKQSGEREKSFCMQVNDGSTVNDNALAIGAVTEANWDSAAFVVKHTGEVICKNIKADGGNIGGMDIGDGLLGDGIKIYTNKDSREKILSVGVDGPVDREYVTGWTASGTSTKG
jgi:hypothetical protein